MKKTLNLSLLLYFIFGLNGFAQTISLDKENREPAYVENIIQRSQKIVDQLKITDNAIAVDVRNIIANRYFELNDIYDSRDSGLKAVKENAILSEDEKSAANENIQNKKDTQLYNTHFGYLTALSLYLSEKQIETVKNGMTFGVLNVTYTATLDMIPTLSEEEKRQIYSWLVEAREYAMNAESSSKKHQVFGKYKGRINNYLSKKGYNLTQQRIDWEKRIKERKQNK